MDTNKIFADMAQRAYEFAEMCSHVAKESCVAKDATEAWREEYRKKHAAGVKFQILEGDGWQHYNYGAFTAWPKKYYREVPQPTIHHLSERKLWLEQREAGTNEVWQETRAGINMWFDVDADIEPAWFPLDKYRIKPKMVKYYFCMFKDCNGKIDAFAASSTERLQELTKRVSCAIIGSIEEREVEYDTSD